MFDLRTERNNGDPRIRLQQITDEYVSDAVGSQVEAISALATQHHHLISLVALAIPEQPETWRYNCYMHVFELQPAPDAVKPISPTYAGVFPGRAFAAFLIAGRLSEISADRVTNDDIVVYFVEDMSQHVGKATSGFVTSKWGTAHLWQHRLFEVPASYGDTVRFFRHLSRDEATAAFVEYATVQLGTAIVTRLLESNAYQ